MSYDNYECAIVLAYRVKLTGVPIGLVSKNELPNPNKLGGMANLTRLESAMQSGVCTWVQLTDEEHAARTKAVEDAIALGSILLKNRKTRADKGVSRRRKKGPPNVTELLPSSTTMDISTPHVAATVTALPRSHTTPPHLLTPPTSQSTLPRSLASLLN